MYPQLVAAAAREIDRAEWSRVILELLDAEAGGNRTRLAEMVGVTYLTIKRWIDGSHSVSEDSVRAVARAFNMSAIDLLIRVGYYQVDELNAPGPAAASSSDEIGALIQASPITPSEKRELNKQVAVKRAEAEAALKADVERWIKMLGRPRRRAAQ
jgi:transcriptional regulator with XRE-family HTH domain